MDFSEFELGIGVLCYDVIVYFVVVLCILLVLDNMIYEINVMLMYNILDVVVKYGINKVIFVSFEMIYVVCFWDGEFKFDYIFVDEDYLIVF